MLLRLANVPILLHFIRYDLSFSAGTAKRWFFKWMCFARADAKSCSKQDFPDPPISTKNDSCIGGVDFVTLVCTFLIMSLIRARFCFNLIN